MTKISSPVKRMSEAVVRDMGKMKRLVVTIYPNDTLGLRPERTQREEILDIRAAYDLAVRQRVNAERIQRKAKRK